MDHSLTQSLAGSRGIHHRTDIIGESVKKGFSKQSLDKEAMNALDESRFFPVLTYLLLKQDFLAGRFESRSFN